MELLLKEYINSLSNWMHLIGCKTEPLSLEGLKKMLEEREMFAMIAALTILPIIVVDKDEAKNLDELFGDKEEFDSSYYRSKIYREVLGKRLPNWIKKGFLDE